MALYVYKCSVCGRTDERFRRAEDREKEYDCDIYSRMIILKPCKLWCGTQTEFNNLTLEQKEEYSHYEFHCPGTMIFQPIQRTHWKMEKHDGS